MPSEVDDHTRYCLQSARSQAGWEAGVAGKFEIYTDASGKFRFRLKAGDGEIVATGEAYESKTDVLNGVDAVKRAAADATIDDKTTT